MCLVIVVCLLFDLFDFVFCVELGLLVLHSDLL